MGHSPHHPHHGHHHHYDPLEMAGRQIRTLRWVFILTAIYLVVEVAGGILTGSLALLADGFHMFADAGAIGISLFAAWFAHRPAPAQKTFGYQRVEILAAFFNALILMAMSLFIFWESLDRFQAPVHIHAERMMLIAVGGLLVNLLSAWLLQKEMHGNMNIRGAYLHVLGDLLGSVAAILAGFLILMFGWNWADPVISGIIAVLVFYSAIQLMREALNILLEGCPAHVDIEAIRTTMLSFDGIQAVHHLHVWNIGLQRAVLTAHLEVHPDAYQGETLNRIQTALREQFGLSHVTLQMELS